MAKHLATTTLDDIIDELRLKYDSSVGLLDGKAIREIPSLNTLQNLNKLLTKLSKNLDDVESGDRALLVVVSEHLDALGKNDAEEEEDEDAETAKRPHEDDLEDESIPLAKRKKPVKDESAESETDLATAADEQPAELEHEDADNATGETKSQVNSSDDPVPPVQSGSFTHDNDTRLKNPKSEFVLSQTLSASAIAELGLFSEDNNGLETQGKEYLKKKYGVASYPENDLQSFLPGEIPDTDFSKTKAPSNQVQFSTFQSYIESFFRPYSNDDIAFSNEKFVIPPEFDDLYDPLVTPYLIPKLGAFYADVWAEEDAALRSKLSSPGVQKPPLESYKPKGNVDNLVDEKLLTEDVSCGPLLNRLLSAILSVHEAKDDNDDEIKKEDLLDDHIFSEDVATQLDSGDVYKETADVNDFYSMEERLKRELKYIGIFMNVGSNDDDKPKRGTVIDTDEWILDREDDEVCTEMRQLQEELKVAVLKNRRRKKFLVPILEEQLAYQEYCTILEDLDKQVDTAYIKRLKAKSKKKKTQEVPTTAQQQAANSGLRALLDKRKRWIDNIGRLFKPAELMKRIPSELIFKNDAASDDEEGEVEDVVNGDEQEVDA